MFKFERLSWKICAIVFLVLGIIFALFGVMFSGFGFADMDYGTSGDEIVFGTLGVTYVLMGVLYLSIAIFNFCMVKRVDNYMNSLYNDACPMIIRCNSVGMIVLGAMFNNIALIFIIINFVRAKSNKNLLNNIAKRQKAFKEQ